MFSPKYLINKFTCKPFELLKHFDQWMEVMTGHPSVSYTINVPSCRLANDFPSYDFYEV